LRLFRLRKVQASLNQSLIYVVNRTPKFLNSKLKLFDSLL
jgi:hypothetical protein